MIDIIAIDPGLMSGVAHVHVGPNLERTVLSTAELGARDTGEWLAARLAPFAAAGTLGDVGVVAERFMITNKTAQNSQAPWSLQVLGQSQWILWQVAPERELILQSPADAKTAFTNPRLRELGLWHRGGKGHALDALRHAALALHRLKLISPSA